MSITNSQIIRIHTLLPDDIKEDKDAKADLIFQYTQDAEKTSTKDLTYEQAVHLIEFLQNGDQYVPFSYYAQFDNANKQHKYILSLCHQIGWTIYHQKLRKHVADLQKLGAWMKAHGLLHKPLKTYTSDELPKLVAQFEKMVNNYQKK